MSHQIKKNVSLAAIVMASVAGGMVLTADLGLTRQSMAQQTMPTPQGSVPSVTIPSFADLAQRTMPSVVSITTTEVVRGDSRRGVDPFDFFFGPGQQRPGQRPRPEGDEERALRSGGSGFIISADGYILTNNHVVEGATKVRVHYGDEQVADAKVIGRDPSTDLALIKITVNEQLPVARLGDSDRIRVGDWAIAIGNPLTFENTLTVGVISAKGRSLGITRATQSFENFIQTDAAINRGNSGGPLLNINGEVVGINTAVSGQGQNIGFATPVNIAKRILPQLRERGKVTRGYLGISITDVDVSIKEAFNLPAVGGAFVQNVTPGDPADRAGIRHGDVVVELDGRPIRRNRELIDYISDQPPGTKVRVGLIRDGRRTNLVATTSERPVDQEDQEDNERPGTPGPTRNRLGMSVQELSPQLRQSYGIAENIAGVVVTDVKEVSPAGEANLNQGDIITEVNGQKISNTDQLRRIVDAAKSGQYLRLYVMRPGGRGSRPQSSFFIVQVP